MYYNTLGIYNMVGNVAEMIDVKGISKGGSFIHCMEDCELRDRINYVGVSAAGAAERSSPAPFTETILAPVAPNRLKSAENWFIATV